MAQFNIETSFELSDGRVLSCEYVLSVTPARLYGPWEDCYPEESEPGEPTYYIDGEKISAAQMPKGLNFIADKLYEAGQGEYNYSESEVERFDADYEDNDF